MSQPQTWWHNGIKYEYFDSGWTILWAGDKGTMIPDPGLNDDPWLHPPPGMPPMPPDSEDILNQMRFQTGPVWDLWKAVSERDSGFS